MSKSVTERLLVALSGGVDSSVSAALLKDQGHEIEGVYVRTWEHEDDLLGNCPGAQDLRDAETVALQLDVPFHVVNFIKSLRNIDPGEQRRQGLGQVLVV